MVYLDFAATAAPSSLAKQEYRRVSDLYFGNPSSLHEAGYQAKRIYDDACKRVLSCTGLSATHRCIFTSGASESNSMAIIGSALRFRNRGNRILYGASEHASVKESCLYLTKLGYEAVELPLRRTCRRKRGALVTAVDAGGGKADLIGLFGRHAQIGQTGHRGGRSQHGFLRALCRGRDHAARRKPGGELFGCSLGSQFAVRNNQNPVADCLYLTQNMA